MRTEVEDIIADCGADIQDVEAGAGAAVLGADAQDVCAGAGAMTETTRVQGLMEYLVHNDRITTRLGGP